MPQRPDENLLGNIDDFDEESQESNPNGHFSEMDDQSSDNGSNRSSEHEIDVNELNRRPTPDGYVRCPNCWQTHFRSEVQMELHRRLCRSYYRNGLQLRVNNAIYGDVLGVNRHTRFNAVNGTGIPPIPPQRAESPPHPPPIAEPPPPRQQPQPENNANMNQPLNAGLFDNFIGFVEMADEAQNPNGYLDDDDRSTVDGDYNPDDEIEIIADEINAQPHAVVPGNAEMQPFDDTHWPCQCGRVFGTRRGIRNHFGHHRRQQRIDDGEDVAFPPAPPPPPAPPTRQLPQPEIEDRSVHDDELHDEGHIVDRNAQRHAAIPPIQPPAPPLPQPSQPENDDRSVHDDELHDEEGHIVDGINAQRHVEIQPIPNNHWPCEICERVFLSQNSMRGHLGNCRNRQRIANGEPVPPRRIRIPRVPRVPRAPRGPDLRANPHPRAFEAIDPPVLAEINARVHVPTDRLLEMAHSLSQPVFKTHWRYRARISSISLKLIDTIVHANNDNNIDLERRASMCLLILPGIMKEIEKGQKAKTSRTTVVNFLNDCDNDDDTIQAVASFADGVYRPLANRRPRQNNINHRDRLLKGAKKYTYEGRLSNAANCLSIVSDMDINAPIPEALSIEQFTEHIRHLFPPPSDHDNVTDDLPDDPLDLPDTPPATLEGEDVMYAIRRLGRGTAPGCSGWTNDLIRDVFLFCNAPTPEERKVIIIGRCNRIALFLNLMLSGKLESSIWNTTRAVLIPKDNEEWRPLGIGEVWYRLMAGTTLFNLTPELALALGELQLCVGVGDGAEIVARLISAANKHPDLCNINVDSKNAFNLFPRRLILRGIIRYCPTLLKVFLWKYKGSLPLFDSSGHNVGSCGKGTNQGDPFAMLFYAVGLQPILEAIRSRVMIHYEDLQRGDVAIPPQDRFDNVDENILNAAANRDSTEVFAFADDANVACKPQHANAVCNIVKDVFRENHIELNPDKCSISGSRAHLILNPVFPIINTTDTAFKAMGTYIGNAEVADQMLEEKIAKMLKPLSVIHHLEPKDAYPITQFCINARPVYLHKLNDPDVMERHTTRWDVAIDNGVFKMATTFSPSAVDEFDVTALDRVKIIRSLPIDTSGLGILRFKGQLGLKSYILSRARFLKYTGGSYHSLTPFFNQVAPAFNFPEDVIQAARAQDVRVGQIGDNNGDINAQQVDDDLEGLLKKCVKVVRDREWNGLHEQLLVEGHREYASILLAGKSEFSGTVFRYNNPYARLLSSDQTAEAIRLRLLLHPTAKIPRANDNFNCPWCRRVHISNVPSSYHLEHCTTCSITTLRHDKLQEAFKAFVDPILRGKPGADVQVKPVMNVVQQLDHVPALRMGDLLVRHQDGGAHNLFKVIDFTCHSVTA